jgi:hypothetical protein
MEYISQNLTAIILAVIALFAVGIIIKISINRSSNKNSKNDNSNIVSQQNNLAGGDIVGRDKKD